MKRNPFMSKCCADPLSAGIGAVGNIAGTLVGSLLANRNARKEREFNAEQAQLNRDYQTQERLDTQEFNLNMWNMNNEYNSPSAQLERAKAAGINPNSIIGDMSKSASSPVTSSPMSGASALSNSAGALGSAMISAGSQIGINTANMLNALADTDSKRYWLSYDQQTEQQRIEILSGSRDKIFADVGIAKADEKIAWETMKTVIQCKEQDLVNARALAKQIDATTRATERGIERDDALAQSTIALNEEKIETEDAMQQNYMQSAATGKAQENLLKEQGTTQKDINEFAKLVGAPPGTPEYQYLGVLASQGKLEDFINAVYKRLERAKLKPSDYYVDFVDDSEEDVETTAKQEISYLGTFDDTSKQRKSKKSRQTRRASFPADSTIVNPVLISR